MNSKDYWAKREAEQLKHYITDEKEYDRQIKRIYTETLDNVQKEINAFYGKYADKEGITLAEAKKRVKELDIKEYERKAARYVKDKDFSPKANEEMRLYNATMKINRLELLKANIGLELISGTEELNKYMEGILQGRTLEELQRQAGILGKTIKNNAAKANAIVNGSYQVESFSYKGKRKSTFSEAIWQYQDLMRYDIGELLRTGLIRGKNPNALAKDLKKLFYGGDPEKDGGYTFCAQRLMRTELARVQSEAQKQSFERNGFSKYIFLKNGGCCSKCEDVANTDIGYGKGVYLVKDMMPGENASPLHPFCRCSTAAYEDSTEYNAWLEYLNKGGTTAEWQQLSAAEKAKYKPLLTNNNNSDIITTPKKSNDDAYNKLLDILQRNNVEYRAVEKHAKKLTQEEIITALAGGDNTSGSCASLGLAYIGQKQGLNVLDFRDGTSRKVFASSLNLMGISKMKGIKALHADGASSLTVGNRLLKQCESGKEYYLCTGRHAAIVRINDSGKLQYLELQSAIKSGWTDFDSKPRYTLQHRFGCNSASSGAAFYDFMIDINESDFTSDDFRALLGFINTAENEQRKGKYGTIK